MLAAAVGAVLAGGGRPGAAAGARDDEPDARRARRAAGPASTRSCARWPSRASTPAFTTASRPMPDWRSAAASATSSPRASSPTERRMNRRADAACGRGVYLPNTVFSRSVVRAAGLVRIFFSSSPTMWNRPSSDLFVT